MPSKSKFNIVFEGANARIFGECPICDWDEEHTHPKQKLHEFAQDRSEARKQQSRPAHLQPVPSTPMSTPNTTSNPLALPASTAPKSRYSPPVVTAIPLTPPSTPATTTPAIPATTTTVTRTTTPIKKKVINVYRVRTVSDQLSVDKTVTGERRKAAVVDARNSHSRQLNIPIEQVSLAFARFIGTYEFVERPKWQSSRGIGGMAAFDDDWGYGSAYF